MRIHPERWLVLLVFLMSLSLVSLAQNKPTPTRPRGLTWRVGRDNQISLTKSTTRLLGREQ